MQYEGCYKTRYMCATPQTYLLEWTIVCKMKLWYIHKLCMQHKKIWPFSFVFLRNNICWLHDGELYWTCNNHYPPWFGRALLRHGIFSCGVVPTGCILLWCSNWTNQGCNWSQFVLQTKNESGMSGGDRTHVRLASWCRRRESTIPQARWGLQMYSWEGMPGRIQNVCHSRYERIRYNLIYMSDLEKSMMYRVFCSRIIRLFMQHRPPYPTFY